MKNYILYWMQQAQRVEYNSALSFATELANKESLKVMVVFCLTEKFKDANLRSYQFMLEGIQETCKDLRKRGYLFEIVIDEIPKGLEKYIINSKEVVCDVGYLRFQKEWRTKVKLLCEKHNKRCHLIETDLIIPIQEASGKQEYMAWTFRKKIKDKIDKYLEIKSLNKLKNKADLNNDCSDINFEEVLDNLSIDRSVLPSKKFIGGYSNAKEKLNNFLEHRLVKYNLSQSPANEYTSEISPYLHFGQISSLEIALEVKRLKNSSNDKTLIESIDQFLEQLIVRRELAFNYIYYNDKYDSFAHITSEWAYKTMKNHLSDTREYVYSMKELESSETHDIYWNAAMDEMRKSGYMHNYMRMYWCKKIIEWTEDYKTAYEISIYLNNEYFLDGRDANSYTGVA
ncbi:MAG: deoxyribodipyrimidine photo-lyase [Halanaerobiales bacterium]